MACEASAVVGDARDYPLAMALIRNALARRYIQVFDVYSDDLPVLTVHDRDIPFPISPEDVDFVVGHLSDGCLWQSPPCTGAKTVQLCGIEAYLAKFVHSGKVEFLLQTWEAYELVFLGLQVRGWCGRSRRLGKWVVWPFPTPGKVGGSRVWCWVVSCCVTRECSTGLVGILPNEPTHSLHQSMHRCCKRRWKITTSSNTQPSSTCSCL